MPESSKQVFSCELRETFQNIFFASGCFSKFRYDSDRPHLSKKSYSENIWKIARSISSSDFNFR